MDKNVFSKFQMQKAETHSFSYTAPSAESIGNSEICHQFSGQYLIRYVENSWIGISVLHYNASIEQEKDDFKIDIVVSGMFEYLSENTPEEKEQFRRLLTFNGALSLFSLLRGQVLTATTALGLSPGFIVPSINLHHFDWQEQKDPSADGSV